jgi:hypothetical protein
MKYVIIFCVGLCYCKHVWAQYDAALPAIVTTATMGLKGNVEEVSEMYNDMMADEGKGAVTERSSYVFDRKGRLTSTTSIAYDAQKQKVERPLSTRYHYNKDGNLASVAMYEADKRKDSVTMYYDGHDRLMRKWTYDEKDRVQKRVQYSWNKHNRLMTVRHKDDNNEIERMIKISYSNDGSTVEQAHLDRQLKLLYKIVTVTNDDTAGGKRIMRFEYNKPDTCTGMISYTTNAQGGVVEETRMDEQKNVTEYTTTAFDVHGNPDSTIQFTTEKWRIQYLHTYDGHGNWIVQAVYKNNTVHHTTGRVILYRDEQGQEQESRVKVSEE